jgi:mono/diheme cytochrome c family protein
MDTNCISCHGNTPSNGAPMSLTTYQNVKDAVLTKGLIDRISRAQGAAGMMPFGGTRLPQSKIDEVINWKNNGYVQ